VVEIAGVRLLRPVRVLVCGSDDSFVSRAAADLLGMGFDVVAATGPAEVVDLAVAERANIVILDASGGLRSAAALAAALEALPQRICVLLASPKRAAAARLGYDVVPAAASADELASAVHRAYRGGPSRAAARG
jgi:hypothetical protein